MLLAARCLALKLLTVPVPVAQRPGRSAAKASPPGTTTATIKMGSCDKAGTYNLLAQRFDITAQAIAHATGCFVQYDDTALASVRVSAVRSRLSIRQALPMALKATQLRIVRQTPDLLRVETLKTK